MNQYLLIKHHPAMSVIGALICLGVGGFGAVLGLQQLRSYGAALIATATFLPGAAALSTVLIFLSLWAEGEGVQAPFWGSGIALLAWVVVALFCLRFADAQHAIPSSYGELCQRMAQVKSQLDVMCPGQNLPSDPCKRMACTQAKTQVDTIHKEFEQRGLSWALARGYINAWNRLHRAEEAMIEVAPQQTVIAGALNDVLRLQGSQIDHDGELIARLRQAIDVIDPTASKYLQGTAGTAGAGASGGDLAQARAVLRDVRCAINEFRDGRWNGLIVARNRLIATMIFTGLTAYALLAIAIIREASQAAITAAATFYLVGATVGLLNQLRGVSQSDTAVEDYGLSTARLITMPLFCGLAAIGGVVLTAMPQMANLSSSITSPLAITTPSPLATFTSATKVSVKNQPAPMTATTTPPSSMRPLDDIFDLRRNFIGLLVAAVFGLTPGLLFERLQQQSDKYKTDLKSSEATQVKPAAK